MAPLNYTTNVAVGRTVGEVQDMLAEHGANAIGIRYTDRSPSAVSFTLPTTGGPDRAFTLPVDVDAVYRLLRTSAVEQDIRRRLRKNPQPFQTREHAARVAWRTAKDWLEAQLAMVAAQMVQLDQVMLPYLHVDGELTLYEAYRSRGPRALDGPGR